MSKPYPFISFGFQLRVSLNYLLSSKGHFKIVDGYVRVKLQKG